MSSKPTTLTEALARFDLLITRAKAEAARKREETEKKRRAA